MSEAHKHNFEQKIIQILKSIYYTIPQQAKVIYAVKSQDNGHSWAGMTGRQQ